MSDFITDLSNGLSDIGTTITDRWAGILGAILVLVIGWVIAKLIRNIVKRIFSTPAVDSVLEKAGIGGVLKGAGYDGGTLIATIVYALLMLQVLVMAANAAEAGAIVSMMEALVAFLPQVIGAVMILVLASIIGGFLSDLVRPLGERKGVPWLATGVRGTLAIFGVIVALNFLGIGGLSFLGIGAAIKEALSFIGMAVAFAFAIAFGVGGIDTAKLWWAKHLAPKR
jgi:hypothetical protein